MFEETRDSSSCAISGFDRYATAPSSIPLT